MSRFACQVSFQPLKRAHSADFRQRKSPSLPPRQAEKAKEVGLISSIHLPEPAAQARRRRTRADGAWVIKVGVIKARD